MTRTQIKTLIDDDIYENTSRDITEDVLNNLLNNIADNVLFPEDINIIPYYDATVGTGGDYPAISSANGLSQAITDGKKNIKIVSDISVYVDITLIRNIKINLNGYSITHIIYKYINDFDVTMYDGTFNSALLVNDELFQRGKLFFSKITFTFTNTENAYFVNSALSTSDIIFDRCTFNLANIRMRIYNYCSLKIKNSIINGGGVDNSLFIQTGANTKMTTLNDNFITGTFKGGLNTPCILATYGVFSINNMVSSATNFEISAKNKQSKIDGLTGNVVIRGAYGTIINSNITEINTYYMNSPYSLHIIDSIVETWAGATSFYDAFVKLTNVTITSAITYSDDMRLDKCTLVPSIITRDNVTIRDSLISTGTITVSATADKTVLNGNRTLTSIVDNGTNTQITNPNLI